MTSNYQNFFSGSSYAVVGHSEKMTFPTLTYNGLKKSEATVYPIDVSVSEIEGDPTFKGFDALPQKVDRAVFELPKEELKDWLSRAYDHGIRDAWVHMGCHTPEAVEFAKQNGINLRTGTCAAMYVIPGFSYHAIHRGIMKLIGKY